MQVSNFHDYWFSMTSEPRSPMPRRVRTSVPYLEKLAGGFQLPSLHMATRMVRAENGRLSYAAIVATFEGKRGPLQ